ncbi:MAG: amidohydrolase [Lachnospiraceae bacterium]|nr:amidohydrolase [Lachnospiraceae bacterium]
MLLIKNGMIHDMIRKEPYEADLLINGSKIEAIGRDLSAEGIAEVIDADGLDVRPGFVDAHSHLGLDLYGIGYEGNDYNEMTNAVCPELRGIDSFNPMDKAVPMAAAGGVTCVATGPGSANVLGGTFFAVKTFGVRVDDMVVRDPVAMKCAFGENPKRVYKDKSVSARMTVAARLREMLYKTREYDAKIETADGDISKMPAFNMQLEALLPVIRGELPLKAHAHQANDILTAIRIAKEFDVKLTLEHCTEGHLIADDLAKEGYMCAVGPTLTHATKWELQNKSWITPGILAEKGCHVSIITDAPVIPEYHLPLCAALAVKAGMDEWEALKAITINPAEHLGIADRVGTLEAGKDADILLMNGSPLAVETEIRAVFINGKRVK